MAEEKYITANVEKPANTNRLKLYILVIIIIIFIIVAYFLYTTFTSDNRDNSEDLNQSTGQTLNQSNLPNQSDSDDLLTNKSTPTNQSNNQSLDNFSLQNISDNSLIPNPTGTITVIDKITNEGGGYFCNETVNPEHAIKLYTYKIFNGVKNLSDEFIETEKKDDFCSYYSNATGGISFYLEWQWNPIENIDGYRVFKYYYDEETNYTIDFNKYRDLPSSATILLDSGLDLWG
ncbi:MAG: hypothetical protein ABIH37_01535 [archaeon]